MPRQDLPSQLALWTQSGLRLIAIIAILATAWSLARLEPWESVASKELPEKLDVPLTNVHPIGVNTFLSREVEDWKRERTVEMAAELGAGWIKDHFAWQEIEPQDDVFWDAKYQQSTWAKYDRIVELAAEHGLRVIARIDQTPGWARPAGTTASHPPTNLDTFGDFIATFVEHFKGRIQFIQIWNEPNLAAEWGGEIDPAGYAELLKVAAQSARAVDPNIVILSAPMATTTENSARAMDELLYWQQLYDVGAGDAFDVIGANAYGLDQPPDAAPDVDILNMRRVELLAELTAANGDADKPIWINEYGWNASPADFPPDELTWRRVDEVTQAEWTVEGLKWAKDHWPRTGVVSIWYLRHVGDISPSDSEYYFRMVDPEFTPRPVYWEVADYAESITTAAEGTYGDLEAPIVPFGSWPVVFDSSSSDGEFIVGEPGSTLQVRVAGTGLKLDLAEEQSVATIQVTHSDAPGDASTIQIASGTSEVKIWSGPADRYPDEKELTITVHDGELRLDGIAVKTDLSYRRTLGFAGIALVAIAGGVVTRRKWSMNG